MFEDDDYNPGLDALNERLEHLEYLEEEQEALDREDLDEDEYY